MSERMPDFRMPSDDEVSAERAALAVADADAALDAHADDPEAPSPRSARRTRLVVAGVAAGALVVGGLAIGVPILTAPSPQQIVDDYVAAIESGDAAAAAELWTPDASGVELALLAETSPSQPPTMTCDAVAVADDGDAATVACRVGVDVEPTPLDGAVTLRLARDGGRWSLESGVEQRTSLFTGAGEVVSVGGVPVPEEWGVTSSPLLLPGVYDAEVAFPSFIVPVGASTVVVSMSGSALRANHELAQHVLDDAAAMAVDAAVADGVATSTGLEATLVTGERPSWQRFEHAYDVGAPGEAPLARVTVVVTMSFDRAGFTIEADDVVPA